ncbi:MAG: HAMP domain-containing sensor histidine kinase [bacterium]|nr:HAMP domain-containing sensor histidine kinase [bacterium]
MQPLLERLHPAQIEAKGRIATAFFENPFLEIEAAQAALRFGLSDEDVESVLTDLCEAGVLEASQGGFRFSPEEGVYRAIEAFAVAHREADVAVRQQVMELETLERLREKLSVTQQEVGAVLEMVPVGVFMLDRFGQVLKSNLLGRRLLGLGGESHRVDICGLLGLELTHILASEVQAEVDLDRPLAVVSRPFRVTGSDAGAVITVQDIRNRREMEAQAERIREEFFSMIRHELRKPLMTIERYLADPQVEVGERESLNIARKAASYLGAMMDDMLLLTRLERDPMAIEDGRGISLRFLLAGQDLAFREKAAEAGVQLQTVLPEVDVVFGGDERRLAQVLGNLLDNAFKFTPEGGTVTLEGGGAPKWAWFAVIDTGSGIPPAERKRVLGKFYQVQKGNDRTAGLGLGLAICQHVILAHGGEIEIGEGEGCGTRVVVRIPMESGSGQGV